MIGLYNSENVLVGYFHNIDEINDYFLFLNRRNINTKGFKYFKKDI